MTEEDILTVIRSKEHSTSVQFVGKFSTSRSVDLSVPNHYGRTINLRAQRDHNRRHFSDIVLVCRVLPDTTAFGTYRK